MLGLISGDVIQGEFVKTLLKTIKRFAKELKTEEQHVQVFFGLDQEGDNVYQIMHNYKPYKTVEYNNGGIIEGSGVFNVSAKFVPDGIKAILGELEKENGMPENACGILVMNKDNVNHKFTYYLYNNLKPVRTLSADEIFSKIKLE